MSRPPSRPNVPIIDGIDLDFRPQSYWADRDPVSAITQNIKGENRRQMVEDFVRGKTPAALGAIDESLLADTVSDAARTSLGRIAPSFMGGEYLPDYRTGEREIARIVLQSSTQDVYALRVQRESPRGLYHYAMVDEYASDFVLTRKTSKLPLTMRQLIHLIDTAECDTMELWHERMPEGIIAWNLLEYGQSAEEATSFLSVSSTVYPDLGPYYAERLWVWAKGVEEERSA